MAKKRSKGALAQRDHIEGAKAWFVNASITLDIGQLWDSGKHCCFFTDHSVSHLKCVFRGLSDGSRNNNEVYNILNVTPVGCLDKQ